MVRPVISNSEIIVLIFLIFTLTLPFFQFNRNNKLTFAHPLIFYSSLMFFYTVLCPIYQIAFNETFNKGLDFREQYLLGWQGALLSAISVLIGYSLKPKVKKIFNSNYTLNYGSLWSLGFILNLIGIIFFLIINGFDLSAFNPFYSKSLSVDFLAYRGGFKNYLANGEQFLITGTFLMFASSYVTQKKMSLTLLNIIISLGIFFNIGFRVRIFLLLVSIILFILTSGKLKFRSSLYLIISATLFLPLFFSYIETIRNYGAGFNLGDLQIKKNILGSIFTQAESTVFITTSGVINAIPEKVPFQNLYPIFKMLTHPLPSTFFNKASGDYLFKIVDAVFGFRKIYQGAAYLNYGEYYIMYGWYGIFIFNFLFGYILKRLWVWINLRKEDPLALVIYILNVSFIFIIISRGYLPQQIHLYMFTIFPLNIIYLLNRKRNYNLNPIE